VPKTTVAEREGVGDAMRNFRVAQGKQRFTQEDDAVEEDGKENADAGVTALDDDWPNGDYPHIGGDLPAADFSLGGLLLPAPFRGSSCHPRVFDPIWSPSQPFWQNHPAPH
jgi:hypothetical protein